MLVLEIISVATLVAVIANIIVVLLSRRDIKRILRQAERCADLLRQEQERLTVLHEERRLLAEQLREAHQQPPDPRPSQQQGKQTRARAGSYSRPVEPKQNGRVADLVIPTLEAGVLRQSGMTQECLEEVGEVVVGGERRVSA